MNIVTILTSALLIGFGTGALADKVYRWTDGQGRQHFSDVPPDGVGAEPVTFSNMSVVKMPRPAPSASTAEPGLSPECVPGYRGEGECPPALAPERGAADVGGPAEAAEASRGDPYEKHGRKRKDVLETRTEQLLRGGTSPEPESGVPKTLSEKLREKAERQQPPEDPPEPPKSDTLAR